MNNVRNTTVFSIVYLLLTLFVGQVNAQDFEVAPVRLEFDAEPASSQARTISVKNHSNRKVSYSVALADFLPSNLGEKKVLPPNSTKRSCANWINVNPSFFELNPGDDIQLQVSMLVPGDEYSAAWCMLYIQPTREQTSWNADKSLNTGISVTGRIGIQVYQSPKSNTNQSVKISNLSEITQQGEADRKFVVTLENLGDKVTRCKVYLLASNMITTEEKQFSVQEYEIFPKMNRSVELILPNDLQPGTYALAAIADYGSKFPLEGVQIVIEVKGASRTVIPDTTKY